MYKSIYFGKKYVIFLIRMLFIVLFFAEFGLFELYKVVEK